MTDSVEGSWESEAGKLFDNFRKTEPQRTRLSVDETNYITRFVRDNPRATMSKATGIERFQAKQFLLPDGRLLIVCNAKPSVTGSHFYLSRGSFYGAYLKIFIVTKGEPRLTFLIPRTPEYEGLKSGRIVFAFTRMGKAAQVFEFDYNLSDHGNIVRRMLEQTEQTDEILRHEPDCVYDHELIRAEATDIELCKKYFTRGDWVQVGWVKELKIRLQNTLEGVLALTAEPAIALEDEELKKHRRLVLMMEILATNEPAGTRLIKLIRYFAEPQIAVEGFLDIFAYCSLYSERGPTPLMIDCLRAWHDSALLPEISAWGRKQYVFSGFEKTVSTYDIDVSQLSIEKDEDAQEYWTQQIPSIPFDGDKYLDKFDMPANFRELNDAWTLNPPVINLDGAEESAQGLLEEAAALRKWTIPPRARVEISFGPFVAAELTELGDEVYFVWRTNNNRYWRNSVGVEKKGYDNVDTFPNDPRVLAAMKLIMAALVRDFLVVEERRKIFDVKKMRVWSARTKKQETRIVYLPRIRYVIDVNAPTRISSALKQGARARHFVRAFIRKVEKPSPIQLEIAKNERIPVPEGYTFVRAHYRGGGEDQRVYRSRSAMQLLFEAVSCPEINPEEDDWFEFERMTADLLHKHLGFTVVSRAAKGGDRGIDIRATKQHGGVTEIWIVQCKCYSPNNPVQPDKIRELVGTMAGVRPEGGQVVRGMFVTSSRYTPGALRTAVEHGIQTIDHDDLINICSAVNRAANRPH